MKANLIGKKIKWWVHNPLQGGEIIEASSPLEALRIREPDWPAYLYRIENGVYFYDVKEPKINQFGPYLWTVSLSKITNDDLNPYESFF
jgi:hypothetical protein